MKKFLFLDCDSTLSAIEGIDELARSKGEDVFRKVEELTNQAMNGDVAITEVFKTRLNLIKPTAAECKAVGQQYIEAMPDGLISSLKEARAAGWTPIIISGGFVQCIEPLAAHLEIETIEAVPLEFDSVGNYIGFDADAPTTRNGGKPEIVARYLDENPNAKTCMVGDGISDMECAPLCDLFIACFVFVQREKVRAQAEKSIAHFDELTQLLP